MTSMKRGTIQAKLYHVLISNDMMQLAGLVRFGNQEIIDEVLGLFDNYEIICEMRDLNTEKWLSVRTEIKKEHMNE